MQNSEYLIAFKMAGIEPSEGSKICSFLSEQTLSRLAGRGKLDRRLIKPVLEKPFHMPGEINDENVNSILNNTNVITTMKRIYCR